MNKANQQKTAPRQGNFGGTKGTLPPQKKTKEGKCRTLCQEVMFLFNQRAVKQAQADFPQGSSPNRSFYVTSEKNMQFVRLKRLHLTCALHMARMNMLAHEGECQSATSGLAQVQNATLCFCLSVFFFLFFWCLLGHGRYQMGHAYELQIPRGRKEWETSLQIQQDWRSF